MLRPPRGFSFRLLVLYPLLAIVAYFLAVELFRSDSRSGLKPGRTAPVISASGWLNGDPPPAEERAGKVTVVEAWFAACPHCAKEAPDLVRAYERFREKGVIFIGLTPDEKDDVESCRRFLKNAGITWPNGYGAGEALGRYLTDGPYFPATWVIGADGKIAWNRDSAGSLEDAIKEALAN